MKIFSRDDTWEPRFTFDFEVTFPTLVLLFFGPVLGKRQLNLQILYFFYFANLALSHVSVKVSFMLKLTPWYDAKSHYPTRNGWYDCKECNARHYFKDGLWYRNKKSLKDGPMTITKLHWRGLVKTS